MAALQRFPDQVAGMVAAEKDEHACRVLLEREVDLAIAEYRKGVKETLASAKAGMVEPPGGKDEVLGLERLTEEDELA